MCCTKTLLVLCSATLVTERSRVGLNSNRHHCTRKCDSNLNLVAPKLGELNFGKKNKCPEYRTDYIFEPTPRQLAFRDYKLNTTYKKTLKLRNLTRTKRSIALKVLPKSKFFFIELESNSRVAPGMCAVYTVTYRTDVLRDIKETIVFNTYTGQDVTVKLLSSSYSPILRAYVFKMDHVIPKRIGLESISRSLFDIERTMALNSSIDSGHTLVGEEVRLSLIMKNEGGYGKFFFINEADWFHYSVLNMNTNMELLIGAFRLYPVYFAANEGEFVEVSISFFPKKYGLFVETIYLLCSNNTCEELDLMGDGVYFENSSIIIGLKQKECKPFFLDLESKYCLHLGKCLSCTVTTGYIKVCNNSAISLEYRWNIRKSENENSDDFKHLASHWVHVEKNIQTLHAYSATEFVVSVNPETTVAGLYRTVLRTNIKFTEPINLIPLTNFALRCQWKCHKHNKNVTIEPRDFEINANVVQCLVKVDSIDIGAIEEDFLLVVNDGAYTQHLKVIAKTAIPKVAFSGATITFGELMKDFFYEEHIFLENWSKEVVTWRIVEETIDQLGDILILDKKPLTVVPNSGLLKRGEICEVSYIANTKKIGGTISFLKAFTNFSEPETYDAVCNVTYNVSQPKMFVHTNTSEQSILCPSEMLFVGVETSMHVCIHNSGTIAAVFIWGNPTGPSAEEFEVHLSPRLGIIKVQQNVHVDVTIKPKSMGYFEDVYLPLFVLGLETVTLVKLMCLVGDITVNVYLPLNGDDYVPILWPKIVPDSYEEFVSPEFARVPLANIDEQSEKAPEGDQMEVLSHTNTTKSVPDGNLTETYKQSTTHNENEVTTLYVSEIECNEEASTQDSWIHTPPEVISTGEDTKTTTSSMTTASSDIADRTIKEIVMGLFENQLTLQQYTIEFQKVPLRTPVKKSIKIENMTPGEGLLYVEVVNFYQEEVKRNVLNEVMAKLNMAKSTAWDDILTSDGIVIKIDNPSRTLHASEIVEFDIWVYASTWGYYVDEIVIDISQMLPFCVSILVEVVGHPIEYPIAQNSICKEPTVRMGVLSYKSENIQRKVKIVNTSAVPVYISWQMFVDADREKKTFSVLLDMPISDNEPPDRDVRNTTKPRFVITNEYFGQVNANYFEIYPLMTKIDPGAYAYIDIVTNVGNFDEFFLNQTIVAYLVGIIKVARANRIQQDLYARPHGLDIGCTKVKVTFEVDEPRIEIDDLPGRIQLSTYATDIVEHEYFTTTRRLIFKNNTSAPALIYLEVEKPFRITSVQVPRITLKEMKGSLALDPDQCMEVMIECVFSKEDILKLVESIKEDTKSFLLSAINFEENSMRILKSLSIYQRSCLQKVLPLELKIFYPVFKAKPVHIQFGNVFVGNTAKSIVSLRNLTATALRYEIFKLHKFPEVKIMPVRGCMPKMSEGEEAVLSIFFTPTEAQTYQVWFAIGTIIPHHYVIVNVIGVGTYDENFYRPGLH